MRQGSISETLQSSDRWKKRASVWSNILTKDMDGTGHISILYGKYDCTDIIEKAIPLKVLFYRHIGTLHTHIDEMAPEGELEKAIQEALLVYKKWQAKYGEFMDGFAERYDTACSYIPAWHTGSTLALRRDAVRRENASGQQRASCGKARRRRTTDSIHAY
jgi:hypothetical protein